MDLLYDITIDIMHKHLRVLLCMVHNSVYLVRMVHPDRPDPAHGCMIVVLFFDPVLIFLCNM